VTDVLQTPARTDMPFSPAITTQSSTLTPATVQRPHSSRASRSLQSSLDLIANPPATPSAKRRTKRAQSPFTKERESDPERERMWEVARITNHKWEDSTLMLWAEWVQQPGFRFPVAPCWITAPQAACPASILEYCRLNQHTIDTTTMSKLTYWVARAEKAQLNAPKHVAGLHDTILQNGDTAPPDGGSPSDTGTSDGGFSDACDEGAPIADTPVTDALPGTEIVHSSEFKQRVDLTMDDNTPPATPSAVGWSLVRPSPGETGHDQIMIEHGETSNPRSRSDKLVRRTPSVQLQLRVPTVAARRSQSQHPRSMPEQAGAGDSGDNNKAFQTAPIPATWKRETVSLPLTSTPFTHRVLSRMSVTLMLQHLPTILLPTGQCRHVCIDTVWRYG
jgi:hypothetical protein